MEPLGPVGLYPGSVAELTCWMSFVVNIASPRTEDSVQIHVGFKMNVNSGSSNLYSIL